MSSVWFSPITNVHRKSEPHPRQQICTEWIVTRVLLDCCAIQLSQCSSGTGASCRCLCCYILVSQYLETCKCSPSDVFVLFRHITSHLAVFLRWNISIFWTSSSCDPIALTNPCATWPMFKLRYLRCVFPRNFSTRGLFLLCIIPCDIDSYLWVICDTNIIYLKRYIVC